MRMSQLIGRTIKETPRDAELISHKYLLRGGFMRQYAAGLYGLLPLAARSLQKIERICREEMNRIEGQEVRMTCMATKELWDETGRHSAIGKDMFRFKDRNDKPMVLNMTHEEPVVFLARTELTSHKQLPAMMYQVQSKFRDEPRPRGGLIRLREFTMKDAYSFHVSEECLHKYYQRAHEAYRRFFVRTGCRNFVSVQSDNGMFGGKYSHEFMMLVPSGEDTLITCTKCDYKANREVARSRFANHAGSASSLKEVATPGAKTIVALAGQLGIKDTQTVKAVLFHTQKKEVIAAFVRGDLDVVEQKLKGVVQCEIYPASDEILKANGVVAGSCGPVGLDLGKVSVVLDESVATAKDVAIGANKEDAHLTGVDLQRDFISKLTEWEKGKVKVADIAAARAGDACPECAAPLQETRGIEIGNIFNLGTRYSASMKATFLDTDGQAKPYVMGCYGIGITRLLPSIIEESHDDRGPILPLPIAPFQVHLNVLNRKEGEVQAKSEALYESLQRAGIEVLLDDRDEKPGSQFADADLLGIPLRVVLSPKTLGSAQVEFKWRDNREAAKLLPYEGIVAFLQASIAEEMRKFEP